MSLALLVPPAIGVQGHVTFALPGRYTDREILPLMWQHYTKIRLFMLYSMLK